MRKGVFFLAVLMLCFVVNGCGIGNMEQNQSASSQRENLDITESETQNIIEESENTTLQGKMQEEYLADLTHDQKKESVKLYIDATDSSMPPVIKISVREEEKMIYEQEVYLHYAQGEQYYLVSYEGKDYLMRYKPLVDHDYATCEYEVFFLNKQGEKEVLDSQSIESSLYDVAELDKKAWIDFAEKENQYLKDAVLIVSTSEAELRYSTSEQKQTYVEKFLWLLNEEEEYNSLEQVLDAFIKETQNTYES